MKYLKYFENLTDTPQVDDYLYANIESDFNLDPEQKEDAKNRIFKVIKVKTQGTEQSGLYYVYKIQAVPEEGKKDYDPWFLFGENIKCFAPTIEELKLKCESQKYNI
jgi:hypothetical protein